MPRATVPSRITAVTVYRCGARVTRVADVPHNGGYPEQVTLGDLPLSLDDGSLAVRVEPVGDGAAPVAAQHTVGLTAAWSKDTPEPPDVQERRELTQEAKRLERRRHGLWDAITRLDDLALPERPEPPEDGPPPESPADGRLEWLAFRSERQRRLLDEHREASDRLQEVQERIRELQRQAVLASTAGRVREGDLSKSLVVHLDEPDGAAPAARLVLEYLVPGARWSPGYSLHFDEALSGAHLGMRALVCQQTGEDWRGVRLSLSTAEPQSFTELPVLDSIRIGRRQPAPRRTGWREPPEGVEALYGDYDRVRPPSPSAVLAAGAAVAEPEAAWGEEEEEEEAKTLPHERREEQGPRRTTIREALANHPPRSRFSGTASVVLGADEPYDDDGAETLPVPCAPPPTPPARPAPQAKKRRGRMAVPSGFVAALGSQSAPAPEPGQADLDELAACEEPAFGETPPPDAPAHLDYGRLRLAPATSPQRGTLRRVPDEEVWLELLAELSVTVEVDVYTAVSRSQRRARKAAAVAPPEGHSLPAAVEGFDYAWAAEDPVEVLSDGQFRSVPVLQREVPVEARYVTVPREGPEAYRFAELDNPLDAPLLPGPADVYLGGDFLLTSPLRLVAPKGRAGVGLGVEERIKVARNTRFEEEASGMLRGRLALRHEVEVELRSHLTRPVLVEVRERVPVLPEGEEDIEVEVERSDPPWRAWEPELEPGVAPLKGGHRWEVTVEPRGERTLTATWAITIPAKQQLVGGNRREG